MKEGRCDCNLKYIEPNCFYYLLRMPWTNQGFLKTVTCNDCHLAIGMLHDEKLAEVVLIYVFKIAFPAFLFWVKFNKKTVLESAEGTNEPGYNILLFWHPKM